MTESPSPSDIMATTPAPVVRVGVAAIVRNAKGKMIMGIRKGFGAGKWQFPGGHLEMGESYFACAERETFEETGLRVHAERVIAITNDVFDPASKHYVTIFVLCTREDDTQEPMVAEPEKCERWSWESWGDVKKFMGTEAGRQRFFLPIVNLLADHPNIEELM